METSQSYRNTILCGIIVGLSINSVFVISEWYATSKNGGDVLLWTSLIFIFPLLLAILFVVGGLLGLFTPWRKTSLRVSLFSFLFFLSGILMIWIGNWVRMSEFSDLAERSKPIISAIEKYEKEKGRIPNSLESLVPEFLPNVPSTGMGAYPEYNYYTGGKAKEYEGNPWVLEVFTPAGGINFDIFFYLPLQNYPERGFGGVLEKVGEWAYVHE